MLLYSKALWLLSQRQFLFTFKTKTIPKLRAVPLARRGASRHCVRGRRSKNGTQLSLLCLLRWLSRTQRPKGTSSFLLKQIDICDNILIRGWTCQHSQTVGAPTMSCECADIHLLCHDDAEFPDVLNYHCVIHQQACWEGSRLFSCDDTGFETDKLNLCKRASAQFIQRVTGRACCHILRTASSCRGPVLQWFVNLQPEIKTFLCQVMSMRQDSIEKEKNPTALDDRSSERTQRQVWPIHT